MNKLLVSEAKDYSGLVTKHSLAALGYSAPETTSKLVEKLYRADFLVGTSDFLKDIGAVEEVETDDMYSWELQGGTMKTYSITRATDIAGNQFTAASKAGVGKSQFYVYFGEKCFTDVMVIVGRQGSDYQLRILEDPTPVNTEFRYKVELMGSDSDLFMPYELLVAGEQFSVDSAPVETTLSKKGAGFNFTGTSKFRNVFTKIRFQDIIPSNMKNRAMKATVSAGGKKFTVWTDYADWERRRQMKIIYERSINYGRLNSDASGRILDNGKSGFKITTGAGLEEQLEYGHKVSYSVPSIDTLIENIMDLSDNAGVYGQNRQVLVQAGRYGVMEMFRQIEAKATGLTPLQSDKFMYKVKGGGFGLDSVFTSFTTRAGDVITFQVDNTLDDPSDARTSARMAELVPGLPGPASSYTYRIMNLGSDGNQNVKLMKVKGTDFKTYYKPGFESDMGKMLGKEGYPIAMADAGCEYHYSAPVFSVKVTDPSRTLIQKPEILG